jgi:protocatechuate 4,5-dioxygenase alpha chain
VPLCLSGFGPIQRPLPICQQTLQNSSTRFNGIRNLCFGTRIAKPSINQEGRVTNDIPGTIIFDGGRAMKGYALNKMFFSFNSAENRDAYLRDEDAYCDRFDLTPEQRIALKLRNVLALLEAGGNIYYLAKWAGIYGLNVQQIGAQQRGMTEGEFKEMLVRSAGD